MRTSIKKRHVSRARRIRDTRYLLRARGSYTAYIRKQSPRLPACTADSSTVTDYYRAGCLECCFYRTLPSPGTSINSYEYTAVVSLSADLGQERQIIADRR